MNVNVLNVLCNTKGHSFLDPSGTRGKTTRGNGMRAVPTRGNGGNRRPKFFAALRAANLSKNLSDDLREYNPREWDRIWANPREFPPFPRVNPRDWETMLHQ